ncbi:MAG: HAMP domain-containing protein [Actinomycetota bacterium]
MSLRLRLTVVLIGVAVGSVLTLGAVNYWNTRSVLGDEVDRQLSSLQVEQARSIRTGLEQVRQFVAAAALDELVIDALVDLGDARVALEGQPDLVDDADLETLEAWYAGNVIEPLDALDLDVGGVEALLPTTDAGRAIQIRYVLDAEPNGDLSVYEEAHDRHVEGLRRLTGLSGLDELLLVDATGSVVFSIDRSIDLGTDLVDGPYRDSGLAEALRTELPTVPVGDGVYVDFRRHLPAGGAPVMFIAASVRDDARVIGAIAFQLDAASLTALTTAGGRWDEIGLGDTGETYVVGSDRLLRSDSRLWLEDPERYLAELDGGDEERRVAELIEAFGSTVLIQPADTEAIATALDGETFRGSTTNYLGRSTSTVASPVGVDGLDWVIVADVGAGETDEAINSYLGTVLLLALVVIPIVALGGAWIAGRLTRPIGPLLAAADRVAGGDLDTVAPDLGGDEFGDLARRLNAVTDDLREQEAALAAEEAATTEMLLAALPPRLVAGVRDGDGAVDDLVDRATVVSIRTAGLAGEVGGEDEVVEFGTEISRRLELLAAELDIERGRSSVDHHLFSSGLGVDDDGIAAAARFALEARSLIAEVATEADVEIEFHAGLATGDIATGILGTGRLSFGIWGEPPRRAMALDAVAAPGQVLLDDEATAALDRGGRTEPVVDLVDLGGDSITASELTGLVTDREGR